MHAPIPPFDAMVAAKSSAYVRCHGGFKKQCKWDSETLWHCAAPMKRIKIQTEWIKRSNPIPHTPIRINYDELIWIVALSPSLSIILVTCTRRHQFIQRKPNFPGFANRLGRSETPGFSGSIQIMGSLFNLNRFILYILQQRADLKHIWLFHMNSDDILPYWRLFTAKRLSSVLQSRSVSDRTSHLRGKNKSSAANLIS